MIESERKRSEMAVGLRSLLLLALICAGSVSSTPTSCNTCMTCGGSATAATFTVLADKIGTTDEVTMYMSPLMDNMAACPVMADDAAPTSVLTNSGSNCLSLYTNVFQADAADGSKNILLSCYALLPVELLFVSQASSNLTAAEYSSTLDTLTESGLEMDAAMLTSATGVMANSVQAEAMLCSSENNCNTKIDWDMLEVTFSSTLVYSADMLTENSANYNLTSGACDTMATHMASTLVASVAVSCNDVMQGAAITSSSSKRARRSTMYGTDFSMTVYATPGSEYATVDIQGAYTAAVASLTGTAYSSVMSNMPQDVSVVVTRGGVSSFSNDLSPAASFTMASVLLTYLIFSKSS